MLKKIYFLLILSSSVLIGANDPHVARAENQRQGGGYNRYEHANYYPNRAINSDYYRRQRINAYNEGIYDGILINDPYNPDVEYTQPGITDNFEQIYEENNQ